MSWQAKQSAASNWEAVASSEMQEVCGGIWDYSNRLGILGQMLEDKKDASLGVTHGPKTLDGAAHEALENWVSLG